MSTRQLASAIVTAAAFALPIVARAETTSDAAQCFLEESRVVSVKPYYGKLAHGRADLPPLLGAKVELVPSELLSAEQLEERVQQLLEARTRAPLPACLADVGQVHIESGSLGEAASVTFIARDPSNAEQVFRRLQLLVSE
jgi:hypothetical protein